MQPRDVATVRENSAHFRGASTSAPNRICLTGWRIMGLTTRRSGARSVATGFPAMTFVGTRGGAIRADGIRRRMSGVHAQAARNAAIENELRDERMIKQLCVNECGRTVGDQLNTCCQPCQFGKPHSGECEARNEQTSMSDLSVLAQLNVDIDRDMKRIAKRFKNPRLTLIVRNPDVANGDVIKSDDDVNEAVQALHRLSPLSVVRKAAAYGRLREIADDALGQIIQRAHASSGAIAADECWKIAKDALLRLAALDAEVWG